MFFAMEGMDTYNAYRAVRLHFTTTYDYFKYHGKLRHGDITEQQFEQRKDSFFFRKLERRFKNDHHALVNYFVANFIGTTQLKWINELVTVDAEKRYDAWLDRQKNFEDVFKNDLARIVAIDPVVNSALNSHNGQHPLPIKLYMAHKIQPETIIALDAVLRCITRWDETISEQIIWPEISNTFKKYKPFIRIDDGLAKSTIKTAFNA